MITLLPKLPCKLEHLDDAFNMEFEGKGLESGTLARAESQPKIAAWHGRSSAVCKSS